MANEIGNITASLKLESAAFIRELTKASQATARSTKQMQTSMAGLQKSFANFGSMFKGAVAGFVTTATLRSFANLTRTIVDLGDEIGAAATKMGLGAEELQRLRFAAAQADVDTDKLDAAFRKFQANVAQGKIEAAGKTMGEAFSNFIARIAEAPTQAEKLRIAIEGLGARGAQTGILLAAAGDEFKRSFNEAFVISQQAVDIADRLDKEWRKVSNAFTTGFSTGFLETLAGSAALTTEQLQKLHDVGKMLGEVAGREIKAFSDAIMVISKIATGGNISALWQQLTDVSEVKIREGSLLAFFRDYAVPLWDKFSKFMNFTESPQINIPQAFPERGTGRPPLFLPPKTAAPGAPDELGEIEVTKQVTEAEKAKNAAVEEGIRLAEQTKGPYEQYTDQLGKLQMAMEAGKITAEQMGVAHVQAAANAISPWLNVADTVAGALGTLFKDNQIVAIAQAVINTAQGITAALAQYPPPLSFAMAAAQAAAGAAQIATIKSTRPGSGGNVKRPSASGGNGKKASSTAVTGGTAPAAAAAAPLGQAVNITIHGDNFSGQGMRDFIEKLNDALGDGARLHVG